MDLIDEVIEGEWVIRRSGQNQCKIICGVREDANLLILSVDHKLAEYKVFNPSSLLRKKAFIRDVEPGYSPREIVDRLDRKSKDIITKARRRTNKDGFFTDTIEFTLATREILNDSGMSRTSAVNPGLFANTVRVRIIQRVARTAFGQLVVLIAFGIMSPPPGTTQYSNLSLRS